MQYCNDNGLPPQFGKIYRIIESYKLRDEPDYDLIIAYLVDAMKKTNSKWSDRYEWERLPQKLLRSLSAIPLKSKNPNDTPIIPTNLKKIEGEADKEKEKKAKKAKKARKKESEAGCAGCTIC